MLLFFKHWFLGTSVCLLLIFSGCALKLSDIQGHWWVIEDQAGYIEFSVNKDVMKVCSIEYGHLYEGKVEIRDEQLIQYEENDSLKIRLVGKILFFSKDSLVLMYGENKEVCLKISDSIPEIDRSGCFIGFDQRKK